MSNVTTRAMRPDDADLELIRDCFLRNEFPRDAEALRWLYLENPAQKVLTDFAVAREGDAEMLAAMYAVLPVHFRLRNQRVLAAQSLDTLTDSAHRGAGWFVKLARRVYERAADEEVSLVYGFPNGASVHGFVNKLGWLSLDPLPLLVRPLNARFALSKVWARASRLPRLGLPVQRPRFDPGYELRPVTTFDATHEKLWHQNAESIGISVDRDAAYLNWRLRQRPPKDYRIVSICEGETLRGFVAWCVRDKHGGRVGYILELLYCPGDHRLGASLLNHALTDMKQSDADLALAWNLPSSPNHSAFRRALFAPFPLRLRPIELHWGVRPITLDTSLVSTRDNWYLSYCDSDTV